jgi:hypothetical protein
MSRNPGSANYRPLDDGEGARRAVRREEIINRALAASTGDAGVAEGDKAKRAVENDNAE